MLNGHVLKVWSLEITSKVSLTGLLAEDKPNVKSFTVNNFNNLDHLKSIIQEVLLSEYNIDMDKNSFIVSNNSGISDILLSVQNSI